MQVYEGMRLDGIEDKKLLFLALVRCNLTPPPRVLHAECTSLTPLTGRGHAVNRFTTSARCSLSLERRMLMSTVSTLGCCGRRALHS